MYDRNGAATPSARPLAWVLTESLRGSQSSVWRRPLLRCLRSAGTPRVHSYICYLPGEELPAGAPPPPLRPTAGDQSLPLAPPRHVSGRRQQVTIGRWVVSAFVAKWT
jgi:hypothetical protein